MKIRERSKNLLSFALGMVVAGVLMVISTANAVEPRQSLEQRITVLEKRVDELAKSVSKKQDAPPPCTNRECE
jgi:CHASE3 domain sensor protein